MSPGQEMLQTPLFAAHQQVGARMVDFAGWSMPLLYSSILDEHSRCRSNAVVFDISHMGRLKLSGGRAFQLLDRACTAEMLTQEDNTARYSLLCNEAGGVIDDIFVMRLAEYWLVVCNAANRQKVLAHLGGLNEAGSFGAAIEDQTLDTAMVAVQGPQALARLAMLLPVDLSRLGRHAVLADNLMGFDFIASRSGYTGEDGLEVILPAGVALQAWEYLTQVGQFAQAGLGARDVLRLEAGLPLYGHELNETLDPISAGLGWAARTEGDYLGAQAIAKVRQSGPARKRVGIRLQGRRIARQGALIYANGQEVGAVSSGTFSPSCQTAIAMGYVDRKFAEVGMALSVQIKPGEEVQAEAVALPFYRGSAFAKRA